jgi:hypothetical protein
MSPVTIRDCGNTCGAKLGDPGSILGRTGSTQSLKTTEKKELPLH